MAEITCIDPRLDMFRKWKEKPVKVILDDKTLLFCLYFYLVWWEHCEGERRWRLLWRGEGGQSHSGIYRAGQPVRGTAIYTRKYCTKYIHKIKEKAIGIDQTT